MDKAAAKKKALGLAGARIDVDTWIIVEEAQQDPDNPLSDADAQRLTEALQELAQELIRRSWK